MPWGCSSSVGPLMMSVDWLFYESIPLVLGLFPQPLIVRILSAGFDRQEGISKALFESIFLSGTWMILYKADAFWMSCGIVQLWSKSLDPQNNVYNAFFVFAAEQGSRGKRARICEISLESSASVEMFCSFSAKIRLAYTFKFLMFSFWTYKSIFTCVWLINYKLAFSVCLIWS